MFRLHLIHWNEKEAAEGQTLLEEAGYAVTYDPKPGPQFLRQLRENPPTALVIDLTRLPSHGRDIALAVRHAASTRRIPLVFTEGDSDKVAGIREHLPDAEYTSWSQIRGALKRAISNPPADPTVPASALAGYSRTPLPKKLGIKPGSVVALLDAPESFPGTLGALPAGVILQAQLTPQTTLTLWFLNSRTKLECGMRELAHTLGDRPVWLLWPKRSSGLATDLTDRNVRSAGLAIGLVDYKVCAVDAVWSGLLFRRRKPAAE